MRKLPQKYHNFIDNIILYFVPYQSYKLDNYSPNFITTLSFITGLLSIYNYYNNNYFDS